MSSAVQCMYIWMHIVPVPKKILTTTMTNPGWKGLGMRLHSKPTVGCSYSYVLNRIVRISNQKGHEQINRLNFPMQYILHCSYSVMQSCWKSEPEDRPQFSELVSTISDILESTAGYVELAMSLKSNK